MICAVTIIVSSKLMRVSVPQLSGPCGCPTRSSTCRTTSRRFNRPFRASRVPSQRDAICRPREERFDGASSLLRLANTNSVTAPCPLGCLQEATKPTYDEVARGAAWAVHILSRPNIVEAHCGLARSVAAAQPLRRAVPIESKAHTSCQYTRRMVPLDSSSPDDFSGVEFATIVCAPQIYDGRKVEDQVAKVVTDFFGVRGLKTRRCAIGGLGAAAGGPWMDVYLWVQENLELMKTIASAVIGFAIGVTTKWKTFRKRLDDKVLDRHMPSIVLEVGARTNGMDPGSAGENSRSLNSLLRLVPALDEVLRSQLPDQKFSIRVVSLSTNDPSRLAVFKVERERTHDHCSELLLF